MKHTWLSTSIPSRKKCTRCGCIRENNLRSNYGMIYYKHGKQYKKAPDCIKFNEI